MFNVVKIRAKSRKHSISIKNKEYKVYLERIVRLIFSEIAFFYDCPTQRGVAYYSLLIAHSKIKYSPV